MGWGKDRGWTPPKSASGNASNLITFLNSLGYLGFDSFNKPDGASPGIADTGQSWITESGTLNIISGALGTYNGGTNIGGFDVGVADVNVSADVTINSSSSGGASISVRQVGGASVDNVFFRLAFSAGVWKYQFYKVIAGTATLVSEIAGSAPTIPSTKTLKINAKGTTYNCYDGANNIFGAVTFPELATGTIHGMRFNSDTFSRVKNLVVRSAD